MTVLRIAIPAVAGILVGWSGGHLFREPPSIATTPQPAATVQAVPAATADGTLSIASLPAAQRIDPSQLAESRDIFRYRQSESMRRERAAPIKLATTPIPVAPTPVALPVEQQQPQLGYTFIGTFGPDGAPIAAFSHNGEVVIAQPGQRIDEHYRLRTVGLESVDVERADGGAMRVAIGSSHP